MNGDNISDITYMDFSAINHAENIFPLPLTSDMNLNTVSRVTNKIIVLERFKACAAVFEALGSIPYAVIKGAVLSKSAYGSAAYRISGDMDILISRSHLDEAKIIFQQHGFIQGRITEDGITPFSREELIFQNSTSHQTAPFVKRINHPLCPYVNIDLNLEIFWGESKQESDMDFF